MSDDEVDQIAEEVVLKIVVCGDGSSGKTSICTRFAKDDFDRTYYQRDVDAQKDTPNRTRDTTETQEQLTGVGCADNEARQTVWDIGGQSIAGEMIDKYIYGSHAAMIVYDVTNISSFDNCQDWLNVIRRVTKTQEKPPNIVLVGNKVDEERLRKVSVDVHCSFARQHDLKAFYVSAKTGDSVLMTFRQVAADVLKIVLTRVDQEADIVIVQGEVAHDVREPRKRTVDQSRSTAVCSIQ
uniref:Ras family protein n=1 Tax=Heterorhabditis bacteriophora TaxID=37862 RepID=A0A1I7XDL3_HETBA